MSLTVKLGNRTFEVDVEPRGGVLRVRVGGKAYRVGVVCQLM